MLCPICNSHNSASSPVCISCGTPLSDGASLAPLSLAAGTGLQGGAYLIQHVLGQGGFGITYLGHDVRLRRPVAIKEFFPTGCLRQNERVQPSRTIAPTQYETIKHRFLEEARTLAQFHHPGIVDVYTCFEENDTAYMVMEFLHGKTLLHLLEERSEHLNEAEAVGYIEKVAEALQVVHQAGLLHRDLKPDNIMVCQDGRVVLIDFGTAKEYVAGKTQNHSIIVTPGYAPLEQYAQRAQRGTYTDIYALAATLYHLLTGELPIAASDRAMGVELTPVQQLNPQVSLAVATAVQTGLATEIAERPQNVQEFLLLLNREAIEVATKTALLNTDINQFLPYVSKPVTQSSSTPNSQGSMPRQTANGNNQKEPSLDFLSYIRLNEALSPSAIAIPQQPTGDSSPSNSASQVTPAYSPAPPTQTTGSNSIKSQNQANASIQLGIGIALLSFAVLVLLCWFVSDAKYYQTYSNPYQTHTYIGGREIFPGDPYYELMRQATQNNTVASTATHSTVQNSTVKLHWLPLAGSGHRLDQDVISADGKMLASWFQDYFRSKRYDSGQQPEKLWDIHIWNLPSGKIKRILSGPSVPIRAMAFSSQSNLLASTSGQPFLQLWNVKTGQEQPSIILTSGIASSLAISPNGQILACGKDRGNVVELWNLKTRTLLHALPKADTAISSTPPTYADVNDLNTPHLAFSPNGKWLASGDRAGLINMWDVQTGAALHGFHVPGGQARSLAFSPDNRILAGCTWHGELWLWNTQDCTLLNHIPHAAYALTFSPDGQTLAGACEDKIVSDPLKVQLWNVRTGLPQRSLYWSDVSKFLPYDTSDTPVSALHFSPNGQAIQVVFMQHSPLVWSLQ